MSTNGPPIDGAWGGENGTIGGSGGNPVGGGVHGGGVHGGGGSAPMTNGIPQPPRPPFIDGAWGGENGTIGGSGGNPVGGGVHGGGVHGGGGSAPMTNGIPQPPRPPFIAPMIPRPPRPQFIVGGGVHGGGVHGGGGSAPMTNGIPQPPRPPFIAPMIPRPPRPQFIGHTFVEISTIMIPPDENIVFHLERFSEPRRRRRIFILGAAGWLSSIQISYASNGIIYDHTEQAPFTILHLSGMLLVGNGQIMTTGFSISVSRIDGTTLSGLVSGGLFAWPRDPVWVTLAVTGPIDFDIVPPED